MVTREKVAVVSKGTMIDAEMVHSRPDASYIMAGACYQRASSKVAEPLLQTAMEVLSSCRCDHTMAELTAAVGIMPVARHLK